MPAARARSSYDAPAKPRSDVYVGLLIIALLAQIAGAVFLYLDYSSYPSGGPPKVSDAAPVAAPPGGGAPGVPPGGGAGGVPPGGGAGGVPPGGKAP